MENQNMTSHIQPEVE